MLTNEKVERINKRIKSLLEEIESDENVDIDFVLSNTGDHLEKRFLISMTSTKDTRKSIELETKLCKRVGFTNNIISREFTYKGSNMIVTSIKPRNSRYPVIVRNTDNGKSYKFPVEYTKKILGGDKIINRHGNLRNLSIE
jgi:hypothetical protein